MPYASITGTPKTRSSSAITVGGRAEDDERMKRSRWPSRAPAFFAARSRIAWCIVGTPVYQVGRTAANQEKNLSALNPGEQQTWPPADSGASGAEDDERMKRSRWPSRAPAFFAARSRIAW